MLIYKNIFILCTSSCNISILPENKTNGQGYQLVKDLKAINKLVISLFPVVPNPNSILSSIPPEITCKDCITEQEEMFSNQKQKGPS